MPISRREDGKFTISASSLEDFLRCGERWQRRYGDPNSAPTPATAPLIAGTGFHACVEHALKELLAGKSPTVQECVDAGIAAASRKFQEEGLELSAVEQISTTPEEALDACYSRIRRGGEYFLTTQLAHLRPVAIEKRFEIPVPNHPDWLFTGVMDMLEDDGAVTDWKFSNSKKAPPDDKADRSLQLTAYATARWMETGEVPPLLRLHFTRDMPGRVTTIIRETRRTKEECERFLTLVSRVIDLIEKEAYHPAMPRDWFCNAAYCSYWGSCKFGGGVV